MITERKGCMQGLMAVPDRLVDQLDALRRPGAILRRPDTWRLRVYQPVDNSNDGSDPGPGRSPITRSAARLVHTTRLRPDSPKANNLYRGCGSSDWLRCPGFRLLLGV